MMTPRLKKIRERCSDTSLLSLRDIPQDFSADDVFMALVETDPTPQKKYLSWLTTRISEFRYEDISAGRHSTVGTTLTDFDRLKKNLPEADRSLMRHKSIGALWNAIKPALEAEELAGETVSSREAKKRMAIKANMESFSYETDKGMKIIFPLTRSAAQFWGKGTRWCTSAEKNNMFDRYDKTGPLIIFITPENKKYQFHADIRGIETIYDWDSPSTLFQNSTFLDDADRELSSDDYAILMAYHNDITEAMDKTPIVSLGLPKTWAKENETTSQTILGGFLDMAQQNEPYQEQENNEQQAQPAVASHSTTHSAEKNKQDMLQINDFHRSLVEERRAHYLGLLKDVASDVNPVTVQIFNQRSSQDADVGVFEGIRAGISIPYTHLTEAMTGLKFLDDMGKDDKEIVLVPEVGQDSLEFHTSLCKTILSDVSFQNKDWSRECIGYSLQQHPEIFTALVNENIDSVIEKGRPKYPGLYIPMLKRSPSELRAVIGSITIPEDRIGEITQGIRDFLRDKEDTCDGATYAVDTIVTLTRVAIETSEKPMDIATIGAIPDYYSVDEKADFSRIFDSYVQHCTKGLTSGRLTEQDALQNLEMLNRNISLAQMIEVSLSGDSLLDKKNESARYSSGKHRTGFFKKALEMYPRLNPDTAFRLAQWEDAKRFKREDISEEMGAKLDTVGFFDNEVPTWKMNASPEIISRLPNAILSSSVPFMTPEIKEAIQNNDVKAVEAASCEQKTQVMKEIFTVPLTGAQAVKTLQAECEARLIRVRSINSVSVASEKGLTPAKTSSPSPI